MQKTEGPPGAERPVEETTTTAPDPADAAAAWAQYEQYYYAYAQAAAAGGYPGYPGYPYGYPYPGYNTPSQNSQRDGPGSQPSSTVWVGGLPDGITEPELKQSFSPYGPIENIKVLADKNYAFLRFARLEDAISAHAGVKYVGGAAVRMGWGKADSFQKDDGPAPCRNLWLGNLDPETTDADIRKEFSVCGPIERVRILPQKSCAFVNFAHLDSALEAKTKLQGILIRGRSVRINFGKAGEGGGEEEGIQVLDSSYLYTGPPQPPAPADNQQKNIIDKLAAAVVKTGPAIEDKVREGQGSNPQFHFLKDGGQYNEYYRWKIFDIRQKQKETDANPLAAALAARLHGGPPIVPPHKGPSLEDKDRYAFSNLLDSLQPTKESIKHGKDFIMSLPQYASAIAAYMCERVDKTPDWTAKQNIIYLANDVLHHSAKKQEGPDGVNDGFCDAFQPFLAPMMYSAHHNQSEDKQEKIMKIWKAKDIYPASTIEVIEGAVQGRPVTSGLLGVEKDVMREALHNASGKYRNVSPPPNISQNWNPMPQQPLHQQPMQSPHQMPAYDARPPPPRGYDERPPQDYGRPRDDRRDSYDRSRGYDDRDRGDRGRGGYDRGYDRRDDRGGYGRDRGGRDRDYSDPRGQKRARSGSRSRSPIRRKF